MNFGLQVSHTNEKNCTVSKEPAQLQPASKLPQKTKQKKKNTTASHLDQSLAQKKIFVYASGTSVLLRNGK